MNRLSNMWWPKRRWVWVALTVGLVLTAGSAWWLKRAHADARQWVCNKSQLTAVAVSTWQDGRWDTHQLPTGACTANDQVAGAIWGKWKNPQGKWTTRVWAIDRGGFWVEDASSPWPGVTTVVRLRSGSNARGQWRSDVTWAWPTPPTRWLTYGIR